MKVAKKYSHFGGEECLIMNHKNLYDEIINAISKSRWNSDDEENALTNLLSSLNWSSNIDSPKKHQLFKNKIALNFHLDKDISSKSETYAVQFLKFLCSEIDISVYILSKNDYEMEVEYLSKIGRQTIKLPLVLIGVE